MLCLTPDLRKSVSQKSISNVRGGLFQHLQARKSRWSIDNVLALLGICVESILHICRDWFELRCLPLLCTSNKLDCDSPNLAFSRTLRDIGVSLTDVGRLNDLGCN